METTTDLIVDAGGQRLDRYISDHLPDLSRAAVQRLIEEGNIRVDSRDRKASYRVQTGEAITVRIPPPEPVVARAEVIPLDIVYEDDNVIVVNKPVGMVVHPAAGHSAGTLVNAILGHLIPPLSSSHRESRLLHPSEGKEWVEGMERPGIVHRLDSETSGLIIVAKNDAAMRNLQAQFKARRVHKTYLALVEGRIMPPHGKIDAPIGRDPKHRQRMAVVTASNVRTREAVTNYRTIANLGEYTLVEAEPQTGRTHQIRVHFAFMGFPVAGDAIYGGRKKNRLGLERQFLHSWKLALTLPDGRAASFTAPLPADLQAVLSQLEFNFQLE